MKSAYLLLLLSWMPLVIGVHMGVTLLVSGVNRQLFIPNLLLPENLLGGLLGMVEIAIALSFIYGALARPAAAALGVTWIIGTLVFGPLRLVEHTEILGVAFFLFATGRGPLASVIAAKEPSSRCISASMSRVAWSSWP